MQEKSSDFAFGGGVPQILLDSELRFSPVSILSNPCLLSENQYTPAPTAAML